MIGCLLGNPSRKQKGPCDPPTSMTRFWGIPPLSADSWPDAGTLHYGTLTAHVSAISVPFRYTHGETTLALLCLRQFYCWQSRSLVIEIGCYPAPEQSRQRAPGCFVPSSSPVPEFAS